MNKSRKFGRGEKAGLGGSINTYYAGKLLRRLTAVADLEYPNDENAVKKVIVEAVENHVEGLENKHHVNPDISTLSERSKKKKELKKHGR